MSATTQAPGTASKQRMPRHIELDALRGAAAVSIIVVHAYQDSRGLTGYAYDNTPLVQHLLINLDYGLGVFFALSGFVIFLPFAKALIENRPHMGAKEFMLRRAFRILPLYVFAIFVVWNSRYYGGSGQIADLIRHLTFTQIYNNDKIFYTIGPAWSLAVEVHYYVGTALLILILTPITRRLRSRKHRIIAVSIVPALLVVASLVYKWWAFYIDHAGLDNFAGPKHYPIYYGALARGDGFGFGMLLAILYIVIGSWRPKSPWFARVLCMIAVGPWIYMVTVRGDSPHDSHFVSLFYYAWVGLATTLVMAAIVLSKPERFGMRLLRARPIQFLGLVSYSLYLWHEPIMIALEKHHILVFKQDPSIWPFSCLALICASVFVAWISYHLIEVPGQRLRKLLKIPRATIRKPAQRIGELAVRRGTLLSALPSLWDEDGRAVDFEELAGGRPLVAFLHPGKHDGSLRPGCVAEARAFRDSAFLFDTLGLRVVGISAQPPEAQKAFKERERLPFPMLSDPECEFTAAAGVPVWHEDSGGIFPDRVMLLVDRFGAIQDSLGADIPPPARPGLAAARSEPLIALSPA